MTDAYHSRARMRTAVEDALARMDRLGIGRATKSIGEVSREYRDLLENLVVAAANGTVSSGSLASQMREAIIDDGRAVYLEGMREGGSSDPEADLDDTDETAIGEWQTGQAGFINGFRDDALAVNDLSGDARTAARDVMLGRVDDWVNALEGLGRLGTANMKRNTYGTWKVGDTEHCGTCNSLNGKRKRLKWFIDNGYLPGEPGSETLDCHGYNCQCQIVDDEGTRIL